MAPAVTAKVFEEAIREWLKPIPRPHCPLGCGGDFREPTGLDEQTCSVAIDYL